MLGNLCEVFVEILKFVEKLVGNLINAQEFGPDHSIMTIGSS